MTILEYYKTIWEMPDAARKYWQCGQNDLGNILWFFNTNFRTIFPAFNNAYNMLKEEEGKTCAEFSCVQSHGQSKVKQFTVRMRQSWFFYVDNNGKYWRTQRGKVFERLENSNFTLVKKNLLTYIFLLSAEFNSTRNYIFERTKEFFKYLNSAGYTTEVILNLQNDFLKNCENSYTRTCQLATDDYFYLANLFAPYGEIDEFVAKFKNATTSERQALKDYVFNNINSHESNCVLSKKYETSGNFNKPMLQFATWIMHISMKLIQCGSINYEAFIAKILNLYSEFYKINIEKVNGFIQDNKTIFENIFNTIYNVELNVERKMLSLEELKEMGAVDPTDLEGRIKQDLISSSLKKIARMQSNYHCILEESENCTEKYFTSKESGENYVEVHHFIPREFSSEFEHSIEILENYIALCPCCHRKIHLAADRERKSMIITIFNKRKAALEHEGLQLKNIKQVLGFYKFDSGNI